MFDSGIKFARIGQYENSTDYTSWDWVEQKRGVLAVARGVDDYVDSLVDNGVTIELQLLYGNPMYTSPADGLSDSILPAAPSAHPPDRGVLSVFWAPTTDLQIDAFLRYVKWTVQHFRGRIRYYELWNEPSEYFWNPTPSPRAYAELAKRVIATIHATDPNAKFVFGAFGLTERVFPREAIEACGCAQGIDVFSYHAYADFGHNLNPEGLDEPAHESESPKLLREAVRSIPGIRPDIEFWNDEFNAPPSWEGIDESVQAKYLTRGMVYDRAAGVRTFIWELVPGTDGNQGDDFGLLHGMMLRPTDFTPRPGLQAVRNTAALFSEAKLDPSIEVWTPDLSATIGGRVLSYAFRDRRGKAIVAWVVAARSVPGTEVSTTADLRIRHTRITDPVLIDVVSGKLARVRWKVGTEDVLESVPFRDTVMAVADASYLDWPALPDTPLLTSAVRSGEMVRLEWAIDTDTAARVVVERRSGRTRDWQTVSVAPASVREYRDTIGRASRELSYRLRAVNEAGKSAYSNIITVETE